MIHLHHREIEILVAVISLVAMSLIMPTEEVIEDIIDRVARGEMEPIIGLLARGE